LVVGSCGLPLGRRRPARVPSPRALPLAERTFGFERLNDEAAGRNAGSFDRRNPDCIVRLAAAAIKHRETEPDDAPRREDREGPSARRG